MPQPRPDEYFAEIRSSAGTLADIVRAEDPDLPIPSCPQWSLRELAAHLGGVHRWAAEIVSTRAAQRVAHDAVPDSQYPPDRDMQAAWLRAGAERLISAVAQAGSAEVWAFGNMAPAAFWARRQAHETMVHRADAELAAGRAVVLDAALAADGIDEWLWMLSGPRRAEMGTAALPPGAVLHLRAAQDERFRDWLVRAGPDAITVRDDAGAADVTVCGPAGQLLLVLLRRLPPAAGNVSVAGERALLATWLASTPFR
jgi:uncharacterized protein (TIGR03083 family)